MPTFDPRHGFWTWVLGGRVSYIDKALLYEPSLESELTEEMSRWREAIPDDEAQIVTIRVIREVGTAMMGWLTNEIQVVNATSRFSFAQIPSISADALEALLVPDYIDVLPRLDGWGHELEFFLNQEEVLSPAGVLAIRSPGRDGKFEGQSYESGQYFGLDYDKDITWWDGYFFSWPGSSNA